MRFVIDETSWCFDGLAQDDFIEAFETLLDLLDDANEQGHLACYSEELFSKAVWQDKSFYELYDPDLPISIPREVQERIAILFARLSKWQELDYSWPPAFAVRIAPKNDEYDAPSIAWAYEQTKQNKTCAVACLVFSSSRLTGFIAVTIKNSTENLWFIADHKHYCSFFRWLITDTTHHPGEMEGFAHSAFPEIDFAPGAFNGIKGMSKPYRELIQSLVKHLGVLSDHGKRIFLGGWSKASAEFGALGVDITDENGK
ncbi:hypothetical protein [Methylocucumis oryzae]|uniref:Uncharacterized protein n=1 Tax=Methylocucumis oryzae TaxID=1632867 RepID=A0A0F3IGU6_9GAMM|nr:hypothetical protein [Methylocucumis oryzae]KJV05758.1 hypothetical protein VZ94_15780 [Methylocucumis oryzae]